MIINPEITIENFIWLKQKVWSLQLIWNWCLKLYSWTVDENVNSYTHTYTCTQMRMQLQVKTFFLILHTKMKIWCPRLRGFSNFSDLRAMHFHIGKKNLENSLNYQNSLEEFLSGIFLRIFPAIYDLRQRIQRQFIKIALLP